MANKTSNFCLTVLLLITVSYSASIAKTLPIEAAMDVLKRVIPTAAPKFIFAQIPAVNGYDVFEVEASGGNVTIRGSSPTAMCRGAYDYIKLDCKCVVTWDGDQLNLPNPLPNTPLRRVVCPVKFRNHLNVCTFSYNSMAWDWKRWERELDWMALHGINMPLSLNGQEKVLQATFKSYGLTDKEVSDYFSGPAFLAWNRMGNLHGKGGPLPQSWIDNDAALQKKILAREKELGMIAVMPAFCGFVPPAFKNRYPSAKVRRTNWYFGNSWALEPRDPLFNGIQKKFLDLYKQEYGDLSGYYLVDLYNEMSPAVSGGSKLQELRVIGSRIYTSLKTSDPNAVWVMQGWIVINQGGFWDNNALNAFMDSVPNDKMIIIDLSAEDRPIWKKRTAIAKRQIIWCLRQDGGQHTYLYGRPSDVATGPVNAYQQLGQQHMVGMGLQMEGIEQNTVMYELMCDMMWRTTSPNIQEWFGDYGVQRYGSSYQGAAQIMKSIQTTFYTSSMFNDDYYMPYMRTGKKNPSGDWAKIRNLIIQMLEARKILRNNPLYIRDLVDVSKRYFGEKSTNFVVKVQNSSGSARTNAIQDFNTYMKALDALLHTVPQHRLERWISWARAFVPEADKNYLEKNARWQLANWAGGDYARKEWSGLVSQLYLARWNAYFNGNSVSTVNSEFVNSTTFRTR